MKTDKLLPILTIVLFAVLLGVAIFRMFYEIKVTPDLIITKEVQQLVDAFKKIDKDCKIIDFDYQKNVINFLNVKGFVGSEVGPMNLAYPRGWKGPYMDDNPTIQEKEYLVVQTKKGYFITPGEGVRLSNGKVVGKDIILDEHADIRAMMQDSNALMFQGKALAAPLPVGFSAPKEVMLENLMRPQDDLVGEADFDIHPATG